MKKRKQQWVAKFSKYANQIYFYFVVPKQSTSKCDLQLLICALEIAASCTSLNIVNLIFLQTCDWWHVHRWIHPHKANRWLEPHDRPIE